jgi:iron complex transport system ATP-binding protein
LQKIIEIKNATVYRGETRVFENLSLEVMQSTSTAILGPNGAGKSTLLKLLSCDLYPAVPPLAREDSFVSLYGRRLWNVWELRSHLGIVSQDLQSDYLRSATGLHVILSGLFSSMDVWSHQSVTAEDCDQARLILKQLEVEELADRRFAAMSTGEQRRLLLGRALIHDPDALVLDEPTSGLDLKACFQYLEIVRGLMRAGKTVVLVTHHIHEIPPEISRVVLLKGGKVVTDGDKIEVMTSENLSDLFGVAIELLRVNGFYQAVPGRR